MAGIELNRYIKRVLKEILLLISYQDVKMKIFYRPAVVFCVAIFLAACGGSGLGGTSPFNQLSGTSWLITSDGTNNTTGCNWEISFDPLGNYLDTRNQDCGAGMVFVPCMISGTYSNVSATGLTINITWDSCWGGSNLGETPAIYFIDTSGPTDVLTLNLGSDIFTGT
jgi:hypothetical protein